MEKLCLYCRKPTSRKTSIYCSNKCQQEHRFAEVCIKFEKDGKFPTTVQMRTPKRFLYKKQNGACAVCGITSWLNSPVLLIFDHINGNSQDMRLENCRMICSNCDATLPTYKSKNRGNGRHSRRQRYSQNKSY